MNEELKQHALRIAEILQEQGNPYQWIEIDADGIKKVSTDWPEPAETSKNPSKLIIKRHPCAMINLTRNNELIASISASDCITAKGFFVHFVDSEKDARFTSDD